MLKILKKLKNIKNNIMFKIKKKLKNIMKLINKKF